MTFREIAPGTRLYIDANIFVYYFGRSSNECNALIRRCERREVDANILEISPNLRAQTGFLVNDSTSLAMMERHDIPAIATNDRDFQRAAGLEVHIPDDL